MNNLRPRPRNIQTPESRVTLTGRLVKTRQGEAIVVKFKLWIFQVNLLVNIPYEGDETSPVFVEVETLAPTNASSLVVPVLMEDPRPPRASSFEDSQD